MFKYSTRGGPGKVRMGCQASIEEGIGCWEGLQGLLGARISRALLVLIEHLLSDGPWAVWPQGRDEKVGEDQAQKGETLLLFLGGLSVAQRASHEGKPLTSGRSGILLRRWCTSGGSRWPSWLSCMARRTQSLRPGPGCRR